MERARASTRARPPLLILLHSRSLRPRRRTPLHTERGVSRPGAAVGALSCRLLDRCDRRGTTCGRGRRANHRNEKQSARVFEQTRGGVIFSPEPFLSCLLKPCLIGPLCLVRCFVGPSVRPSCGSFVGRCVGRVHSVPCTACRGRLLDFSGKDSRSLEQPMFRTRSTILPCLSR